MHILFCRHIWAELSLLFWTFLSGTFCTPPPPPAYAPVWWHHHRWRNLVNVKRCVPNQGIVVPKLLAIGHYKRVTIKGTGQVIHTFNSHAAFVDWTSPIFRLTDFLLVAHSAEIKMKYVTVKYRSWGSQDSQKLQNNVSSHYPAPIFALCIYFYNMKPHSLEFVYLERQDLYTRQVCRGCKIWILNLELWGMKRGGALELLV